MQLPFFNRVKELAQLERWWSGQKPELITLYGRRRIGKTEMLTHFLADKRAIYFYADKQLVSEQLKIFTEQVALLTQDAVIAEQPFSTWEVAWRYTLRLAERERLAIVIDEFSYAADADPALASIIQRHWDSAQRNGSQTFIILCTSFTEAVERHFLADGPLYGRRTHDVRLKPFTYRDSALFFPGWSHEDQVNVWGAVGGVPSYLHNLQSPRLSEAIIEGLLERDAPLYDEAETMLTQEVRGTSPAILYAMLQAIAYGQTEPSQLAQRVGKPVTALSGALRYLVDYGLVERRMPFTVSNPERTRQSRYYLADNYLSFWFRFVLPNRSALEQGRTAWVWSEKIEPYLTAYMGPRFEALCREFIMMNPDRWNHPVNQLGVWWSANEELEIVGHDGPVVTLAAEAKWTSQPVDLDVLHTLQRRVALIPGVADDCQLVIFSRSGFTERLKAAETPYLTLLTLDDLYEIAE